jgi:hypothetical protein
VCAAPRFNSSGLKKVCTYWTVQKVGGENGSIEPSQMGHHSGWGPNIVPIWVSETIQRIFVINTNEKKDWGPNGDQILCLFGILCIVSGWTVWHDTIWVEDQMERIGTVWDEIQIVCFIFLLTFHLFLHFKNVFLKISFFLFFYFKLIFWCFHIVLICWY